MHGVNALEGLSSFLLGRATRFGFSALVYTLLFVAVLISVNWLVVRNDYKLDLTKRDVYSLSSESLEVLNQLPSPVTCKLVRWGDALTEHRAIELLKWYEHQSNDKFSFSIIDPRTEPQLVKKYGFTSGDKLYLEIGSGQSKRTSKLRDSTESTITSGIIRLIRQETKRVYYITGHSEPDISSPGALGISEAISLLNSEGIEIEQFSLPGKAEIPTDAAALILNAPTSDLHNSELTVINNYLEIGGRIFVATDPLGSKSLREFLLKLGINVQPNVIVDQMQHLFGATVLGVEPIVRSYNQHPITEGFTDQNVTVFNTVSSLSVVRSDQKSKVYTELALTSPSAWGRN